MEQLHVVFLNLLAGRVQLVIYPMHPLCFRVSYETLPQFHTQTQNVIVNISRKI